MGKITIHKDSRYAPCSYIVCKVDDNGKYDPYDERKTILFQVDYDFPLLASFFGFIPCKKCNTMDGTVPCKHHTSSDMIKRAKDFLDNSQGIIVDDPGYFED